MKKYLILFLLFCCITQTCTSKADTIKSLLDNVTYFFISENNTLYGIGSFEDIQSGIGKGITYKEPERIMYNVKSILSDSMETYAIKTDGSLWFWGYNNVYNTQLTPVKIMEDVSYVSSYDVHTLILKEDGTLWGFGYNECNSILPTDVEVYDEPQYIMSDVKDMKAGIDFSVILKTDGSVWTFGKNSDGYLGDGTTENRAEPQKILDNIKDIFIAQKSCFAIDNEDNMWMWGSNLHFSRYYDERTIFSEPVLYVEDAKDVSVPHRFAVVLKTDGSLWAYASPEKKDIVIGEYSVKSPYKISDSENFVDLDGSIALNDKGEAYDLYYALTTSNGKEFCKIEKITDNVKQPEQIKAKKQKNFTDISDKPEEMQKAINSLTEAGIISGTSETEFSPDKSITRAEIAALLLRMTGKDKGNDNGGFSDVPNGKWYYGVAGASKEYNIISGYDDNTFRGDDVISKEQLVSLVARVLRNEKTTPLSEYSVEDLKFSDNASISEWAKNDIALAVAEKLIEDEEKLFPKEEMTRADAVVVLYRLYNLI